MDLTVSIPDSLLGAVDAATAAKGDKDANAWLARVVREALAVDAQQMVEQAQKQAYQAALDAATRQLQQYLGAICANRAGGVK